MAVHGMGHCVGWVSSVGVEVRMAVNAELWGVLSAAHPRSAEPSGGAWNGARYWTVRVMPHRTHGIVRNLWWVGIWTVATSSIGEVWNVLCVRIVVTGRHRVG